MGFTKVFDYAAGKADWLASGLPTEGKLAETPRAGGLARADVLTCELTDRLADVWERTESSDADQCVVVNDENIVLGRLRKDSDLEATVEAVMESGPSTFRPDVSLKEMEQYMTKHGMADALITTSDGVLVGVLYRQDIEQALNGTRAKALPRSIYGKK